MFIVFDIENLGKLEAEFFVRGRDISLSLYCPQESAEYIADISKEIKAYIKGEYGKAPGEIDADLQKKVLGDDEPVKCRFADTLEPAFEAAKAEIGKKAHSDEDVLSYIAFPTQAENFFDYRDEMASKTYSYEFKALD